MQLDMHVTFYYVNNSLSETTQIFENSTNIYLLDVTHNLIICIFEEAIIIKKII